MENEEKKSEWTSSLGAEERTLLKKLLDFFEKILLMERVSTVKKLWIVSIAILRGYNYKWLLKWIAGKNFTPCYPKGAQEYWWRMEKISDNNYFPLFKGFKELIDTINLQQPTKQEINDLQEKLRLCKLVNLFLGMISHYQKSHLLIF